MDKVSVLSSLSRSYCLNNCGPQKPLKTVKASRTKKKVVLTDLEALGSSSPDQQQHKHQSQSISKQLSSSQLPRQSSTTTTFLTRSRALRTKGKPRSFLSLIRYGRVVRFQAADGGFLLVESDGCLRKVPAEHASDPRTRITLFPRDPIATVGKQNRHVRSGDWAFIVQGSAAALETELGIARADSDEMIEGPKYLVNEVVRHDAASARQLDQQTLGMQQHKQQAYNGHHLSKQTIRKKQLAQAFPQETETMLPTVWCLARVPRSSSGSSHKFLSSGDRSNIPASPGENDSDDKDEGCLVHGAQVQLFQNSFVVCYELQSSKDDDNNSKQRRRVSMTPGSAATSNSNRGGSDSRSSQEMQSSEGEPSDPSTSEEHLNESIFTHLWLQETPEFAASYHPMSCSCGNSSSPGRRKAIWDNTWTICDVKIQENQSKSSRDSSLALPLRGSGSHEPPRRRSSKPGSSTSDPLSSADPNKLDTGALDGDGELDPLSEQEEDDDVSEDDDDAEVTGDAQLQRQLSVFDVEKFAVKAETQQARAARIIVRFFRRLFREEVTHSRVQDFLRRRRRLTHTKKHAETHLSTREQLKLLQCYNPKVFGSKARQYQQRQQQHGLLSFDTFTNRAEHDRQKLATMKCDVDFLNRDWLCTERHSVRKVLSSAQSEMYSRRPLSSHSTSQRILANREREHQFHVDMKMAKRDPPSFHYGGIHSGGQRPRTAPIANDLNGAKSP